MLSRINLHYCLYMLFDNLPDVRYQANIPCVHIEHPNHLGQKRPLDHTAFYSKQQIFVLLFCVFSNFTLICINKLGCVCHIALIFVICLNTTQLFVGDNTSNWQSARRAQSRVSNRAGILPMLQPWRGCWLYDS